MATALVSEPPRPSVAMRLRSGSSPWKPVTTATSPESSRSRSFSPGISMMRAAPCAASVRMGICQPCHERAWTPIDWSAMARRPAVTFSPDATIASYSRASCSSAVSRTQPTSWFVVPAMAETTTATRLPASTSRFTCCATFRIRSTLATDVPPNFITTVVMALPVQLARSAAAGCPAASQCLS